MKRKKFCNFPSVKNLKKSTLKCKKNAGHNKHIKSEPIEKIVDNLTELMKTESIGVMFKFIYS